MTKATLDVNSSDCMCCLFHDSILAKVEMAKMAAETSAPNNIILYSYAFSPFGKRVSAYLALRGIEYALCVRLPFRIHLIPTHKDDYRTSHLPCRAQILHSFPYTTDAYPSSPSAQTYTSTRA
jgi:hypothetical protein